MTSHTTELRSGGLSRKYHLATLLRSRTYAIGPTTASRVAAAKALEQMRGEAVQESGGAVKYYPGVVVVIELPGGGRQAISPPRPTPMVDVTPIERSVD
jgi:hypothetical protein